MPSFFFTDACCPPPSPPASLQGFEIGSGFTGARMTGSAHNDEFYMDGERVRTRTNRSGGIQVWGREGAMPSCWRWVKALKVVGVALIRRAQPPPQ